MPAERSRLSRRAASDGDSLVWTESITAESASGAAVSFATPLTSTAFSDDAPAPQTTFLHLDPSTASISEPTNKRLHRRRVASDPGQAPRVPRPANAFILFRSSFVRARAVPTALESSHAALSAIAGHTWRQLPPDQKAVWFARAAEAKQLHKVDNPTYGFKTQAPPDSGGRRAKQKQKSSKTPRARDLPPNVRRRGEYIASLVASGYIHDALHEPLEAYDAQQPEQFDVRFSVVETPEALERKQAQSPPKKRKTSAPTTRRKASSTPPPFDFAFDFSLDDAASACSSAVDSPSAYSAAPYVWPGPAPEFDFSSPFAFDSAPSTAPASPALSFASASSPCSSSLASPASSYEDLNVFLSPPAVVAPPSHLDFDLSLLDIGLNGLDGSLGCGLGLDALLSSGDLGAGGCIAPGQTMHAPVTVGGQW
ncbi:HMG box domain-containing protein [Mycena kentingensis (nom. inval.)]|nr:HMG box domain-containing protein [Mycena kentingensis (nom. inval.)]